ncbi:transporter substrate-binding domain-containing diguanylate cyclase [Psychromonas ossibalaenae]|uniref:transporter substrate-binding domain-containing diguanylate cyclase n=1 Tax=Psychromonas ossibalaenae TaxID=444922 RepID=UPI000372D01B|nr:diguanylate cyclase [Psychromonas ossibalaenae]
MRLLFLLFLIPFSMQLTASEKTLYAQESDSYVTEQSELVFSEQELSWIQDNPTVSVIGAPAWFPYEGFDEDGQFVGIVAETLTLISEKSGLKFEVTNTNSWSNTIELGKVQKADIISGSTSNPQIEKQYRATYSTIENPVVMIARGDIHHITDLNAVKDLRIAVMGQSGYGQEIIANYPDIDFVKVDSINEALLGVADDKYDVVLLSMAEASYQMAQLGLYELRVVGITDIHMQLTLFVNRDKPILWNIINKVKKSETTQERHQILSKWVQYKYIDRSSSERMRVSLFLIVLIIAFFLYRRSLLKNHDQQLIELSQTDKLTGCSNRLYLDKLLRLKIAHSQRYKTRCCLILVDIDHFKRINDNFGYLQADKVLVEFSGLLISRLQSGDVLGRWGGGQFLIVCPETSFNEAERQAEEIRAAVKRFAFSVGGGQTACFGVVQFNDNESVEKCLNRADDALYCAKKSGSNQVSAS